MKRTITLIVIVLFAFVFCSGCTAKGVKSEVLLHTDAKYKMIVDDVDRELDRINEGAFTDVGCDKNNDSFQITKNNLVGSNRRFFEIFGEESTSGRLAIAREGILFGLKIWYLADAMQEHEFYYCVDDGPNIIALNMKCIATDESIRYYISDKKVIAKRTFIDAHGNESNDIEFYIPPEYCSEEGNINEAAVYNWWFFEKAGAMDSIGSP